MRTSGSYSGFLTALGPVTFLIYQGLSEPYSLSKTLFFTSIVGAVSGLITLGGLLHFWVPRVSSWLAGGGFYSWIAFMAWRFGESPALSLSLVVIASLSIYLLWISRISQGISSQVTANSESIYFLAKVRTESIFFLLAWAAVQLLLDSRNPRILWATFIYLILVVVSLLTGLVYSTLREALWTCFLFLLPSCLILYAFIHFWHQWERILPWIVILPALALCFSVIKLGRYFFEGSWFDPFIVSPARILVTTFLMLCLLGSILLSLPWCNPFGGGISLIDSIFTAVSAVCVTGLIVLDTPVDFSFWGQLVILILIQLGGLGIMTFSTAALAAMGQRLSLRQEGIAASLLAGEDRSNLYSSLWRVLRVTFLAEGVGFVVLTSLFLTTGDSLFQGIWRGLFTSISAFCNAGFALQSNSMVPYQHNALILHVVSLLIILGGLSPLVIVSIPQWFRGKFVPLQVKLCVVASVILLGVGAVVISGLEWNRSLDGLPWNEKLNNAWFQSATTRTAGFNSVEFESMRPATLTVVMTLMFIGDRKSVV